MSIKAVYFGSGLAGRKTFENLKVCGELEFLEVYTSDDSWNMTQFRDWESVNRFLKDEKIEAVVLCSFGEIVPKKTLAIPKYGWWNVHYSLLPKYRGAVPIQRALLNGDSETGVTVQKMASQLDAGAILSQEKVDIKKEDDAKSLVLKCSGIAGRLLCEDLPLFVKGKTKLREQEGKPNYCYASLTDRENRRIYWTKPCETIINKIRAFVLNSGSWTAFKNGKEVKIFKAESSDFKPEEMAEPGTVLKNKEGVFAKCADGWIKLKKVQVEGKDEMSGKEFGNGYAKNTAKFE